MVRGLGRALAHPVPTLEGQATHSLAGVPTLRAGTSGYTPLHYAAREGHEPMVELLLRHGQSGVQARVQGLGTARGGLGPGAPLLVGGALEAMASTWPSLGPSR